MDKIIIYYVIFCVRKFVFLFIPLIKTKLQSIETYNNCKTTLQVNIYKYWIGLVCVRMPNSRSDSDIGTFRSESVKKYVDLNAVNIRINYEHIS